MKMQLLGLFILGVSMNTTLSAQGGKILEGQSLNSIILNMERKYSVYLPPGYAENERNYPVLYLLHGAGGDYSTWIQSGEMKSITDRAIAGGLVTPMIIIMPDAREKIRGYFNYIKGGFNYEDFFFDELIPHVEKIYRCRTQTRFRAIAGQSMGGGGTIFYALHHPEMFSAAAPLSAATGSWTREDLKIKLVKDNIEGVTETLFESYYKKHSVPELLSYADSAQIRTFRAIRWYISCGDDDNLSEGNCKLHLAFRKAGINHEFRIKNGAHNWSYWRQELWDVLHFISKSFTQY